MVALAMAEILCPDALYCREITVSWCQMRRQETGFAAHAVVPHLPHLSVQNSPGWAALLTAAVIPSEAPAAKLGSQITRTCGCTGAIAGFEQ
jgi:hypothetical protein